MVNTGGFGQKTEIAWNYNMYAEHDCYAASETMAFSRKVPLTNI